MNCQSFETVVNDLARAQMIEAATRAEALKHSSECRVCAARLEDERALTGALRELAAINHSIAVNPDLQNNLLAEFRHQRHGLTAQRPSSRRYSIYAAAAAVLFLAFAGFAYQSLLKTETTDPVIVSTPKLEMSPAPPVDPNNQTTALQPPIESPKKATPRSVVAKQTKRPRPRATSVDNKETVATNHNDEVVSEFIPIGYSSAVSVEDGGQLVRIEMSRAAMARFGIPINMERYNERVKADVLVSADGLARAIRFVQ
jgi:hypothetical protein